MLLIDVCCAIYAVKKQKNFNRFFQFFEQSTLIPKICFTWMQWILQVKFSQTWNYIWKLAVFSVIWFIPVFENYFFSQYLKIIKASDLNKMLTPDILGNISFKDNNLIQQYQNKFKTTSLWCLGLFFKLFHCWICRIFVLISLF